jgi:hypothetical protein
MTLLRAFWDAAREVANEAAATSDEGTVMRWCREGELAELWQAAGLREARFEPLIVSAGYTDFEELRSPLPRASHRPVVLRIPKRTRPRRPARDAYRRPLGAGDQSFELTPERGA